MKKTAAIAINFILALSVVWSTVGVDVYTHFCGCSGAIQKSAFEAIDCKAEESGPTGVSCCGGEIIEKSCCAEEVDPKTACADCETESKGPCGESSHEQLFNSQWPAISKQHCKTNLEIVKNNESAVQAQKINVSPLIVFQGFVFQHSEFNREKEPEKEFIHPDMKKGKIPIKKIYLFTSNKTSSGDEACILA